MRLALFAKKLEELLKTLKIRRRVGADSRRKAREESSKLTAAHLGARAPAEAAPARDRWDRGSRAAVQFMRPGLPHVVVSDQKPRADATSESKT